MACAGCTLAGKRVDRDPMWVLIKAPSLSAFPFGSWETPQSEWTMVNAYATEAECKEARFKAQTEQSPRPFACISTESSDYAAIAKGSATRPPAK